MLRFITCHGWMVHVSSWFQYIQCYGSSGWKNSWRWHDPISIHPMLRFIEEQKQQKIDSQKFQYIQCYGSSRIRVVRNGYAYISIHPMLRFIKRHITLVLRFSHFNTSNVTVHLAVPVLQAIGDKHFNTSNVTVHQAPRVYPGMPRQISIHPMLRFINGAEPEIDSPVAFQYIQCYGSSWW